MNKERFYWSKLQGCGGPLYHYFQIAKLLPILFTYLRTDPLCRLEPLETFASSVSTTTIESL